MKIAEQFEQGSPEWHKWRRSGVGASEAASLFGVGYSSEYETFLQKTGRAGAMADNPAMLRGRAMEPIARELYTARTGIEMRQELHVYEPFPVIFASLDGISQDGSTIVEIKVPTGEETVKAARSNNVPRHYYLQIQQQLLCSGARFAHFWVYDVKDAIGHLVEVKPNPQIQREIIKRAKVFWDLVKSDKPPKLTAKDHLLTDNKKLAELLETYGQMQEASGGLKKSMDELRKLIGADLPHVNILCGGYRVTTVNKIGAIDYKSVPEIKGVDLDQYRKAGSSYIKISKEVAKNA